MAYNVLGTMRDTLKDLVLRIKGIKNNDGSDMFRRYGVWNDQFNNTQTGKGDNFLTPACFVEIEDFKDEQMGFGVTGQDVYINFHIIHQQLDGGQSQLGIDEATFDMDLDVFFLRNKVRKVMTNFNPSNCSSLGFAKEKQDSKHNNLYHFIVTFKTKYLDFSACPFVNGDYRTIPAGQWTLTTQEEYVDDVVDKGVGYDIVGSTLVIG